MEREKKPHLLRNVPIIVGFLILLYFGGGAFSPTFGHAILAITSLLVMAYLVWVVLPALNWEQEEQRKRSEQPSDDTEAPVASEKKRVSSKAKQKRPTR